MLPFLRTSLKRGRFRCCLYLVFHFCPLACGVLFLFLFVCLVCLRESWLAEDALSFFVCPVLRLLHAFARHERLPIVGIFPTCGTSSTVMISPFVCPGTLFGDAIREARHTLNRASTTPLLRVNSGNIGRRTDCDAAAIRAPVPPCRRGCRSWFSPGQLLVGE